MTRVHVGPQGGAVVVLGGDAASDADVWRSDDDGASWARVTSRPAWGARWAHSATALEVRCARRIAPTAPFTPGYAAQTGELVVVGGTPDEKSGSGGWTSKDGGASWGEIGAPLQWEARAGHASVVLEVCSARSSVAESLVPRPREPDRAGE